MSASTHLPTSSRTRCSNVRFEMDEVVRRAAMSPMIREQHDEFPMVCDRHGRMVVGQFGSYIPGIVERLGGDIRQGDVILFNDPYLSQGSITHLNDWCVVLPIFVGERHIGFASMFGHMMDVGGKVAGSQVNDATSIWEEGLRIPPPPDPADQDRRGRRPEPRRRSTSSSTTAARRT